MAETLQGTAGPRGRSRPRALALAACALALYALLVDAALETWQALSPVRWYVAAPVAVYVSFTAWLLGQHRSNRPSAATSVWISLFLLLALITLTASEPGGLSDGIRMATLDTSTVASLATIAVILLALASLGIGSPLPLFVRLVLSAAAVYGVAAFVTGVMWHRSYVQLLHGASLWATLPYWAQGAFVGALVVVPLGLALEVGVALARVKVRGRLHRIVAFALGCVLAYSAFIAR